MPILTFYSMLFRESKNLPEMDDYDAVLAFLNTFFTIHGFRNRLLFFFGSQHVHYKLFFEHLVVLAEVGVTGHINFVFLQQVGNLFVLLTSGVLWLLFQPRSSKLADRLLLFTPVVFLLFAPCYGDTLNWAMGSLQNLIVVFFALLCLYLLHRKESVAFFAACVSLVSAIASSGNGFFLALVGLAFLWQQRHRFRMVIWTFVTLAMGGLYAYHFSAVYVSPPTVAQHPHIILALFPLAFLAAAAGRVKVCVLIALVMVGFAGYLISRRWRHLDPSTFYAGTFIIVTAIGVDLTRHQFGLEAALVSRYCIYSQLFLCLLYMAALRLPIDCPLTPTRARVAKRSFAVLTLLFCISSDVREVRILHRRTQLIRDHYVAWTRNPQQVSLVPDEDPNLNTAWMVEFRQRAVITLKRSEELGLYYGPASGSIASSAP